MSETQRPRPLPEVLRSFRRYMGITQEQAARFAGVDRVTWNRWERGSLVPDRPSRRRLRASEYAARRVPRARARGLMRLFLDAYEELAERERWEDGA